MTDTAKRFWYDFLMLLVMILVFAIAFSACAPATTFGRDVQDCVVTHLRIVSKNAPPTDKLYETIVESCRSIHGGRP